MVLGGMRGWQRRNWRDRGKAERVELQSVFTWYATIWVFELTWLGMPVVDGVRHRPVPLVLGGLLLAVGLLQCVAANRLARPALDHYLGRAVLPPRALRGSLVLLALALVLPVVLALVGGIAPWTARLAMGAALLTFGLTYGLLATVPVLVRRSALLAAVLMAVAGLAFRTVPDVLMTGFLVVFAMGMSLLAVRCGAWTLSVLWEAERARETEARLAVAEERLRFGRDLHDVLGRNLAVIALKAELAVRLGRRGRPEAVDQMVEVQRLAQESQREVRAVVRGYREADLAAELAGAQGVLGAAGIDCAITGSAAGLPAPVQSALAWVVREATTNVLRHGDARSCAIALRIDAGRAGLSVENDGAPRSPGGPPGSGLAGLRERLSELDGTLCAGLVAGGRFRLTAEVPLRPAGDAATETAATAEAATTPEAAAIAEAATTPEAAAIAEAAATPEGAAAAEAVSTAVTAKITRASSEVTP
ncbi:sensor histidine kinase [Streptomyces similanensis]|uniref:Signal transduction histidine kinase subgroup 3 dimerisation and phosphoacceptor domain-containing protein n=1 Tax=Streptomyces similanensis TaxID=1274988 RepID=A0ABP9LH13_9ACTN